MAEKNASGTTGATGRALKAAATAAAAHTALDAGLANGLATLDAGAKLPTAQLPDEARIEFKGTVADEAAMLALSTATVQLADYVSRTDTVSYWKLNGSDPSILGNWVELSKTPADVQTQLDDKLSLTTGGTVGGVSRFTNELTVTTQDDTDAEAVVAFGQADALYGRVLRVNKAVTTSRASTTVLTADPDLQFANVPLGEYDVNLSMTVFGEAPNGFAWDIGGTATITRVTTDRSNVIDNNAIVLLATWPNGRTHTGLNFTRVIQITGTKLRVTAAGSVSLDWAQAVSDAANTSLFLGHFILTKTN